MRWFDDVIVFVFAACFAAFFFLAVAPSKVPQNPGFLGDFGGGQSGGGGAGSSW